MSRCNICGKEKREFQVKKEGKNQGRFFEKCPDDCRGSFSWTTKPQSQDIEKKPDWDSIAEGKVRHGLVCAMIRAGIDKNTIKEDIDFYTNLIIKKQVSVVEQKVITANELHSDEENNPPF